MHDLQRIKQLKKVIKYKLINRQTKIINHLENEGCRRQANESDKFTKESKFTDKSRADLTK